MAAKREAVVAVHNEDAKKPRVETVYVQVEPPLTLTCVLSVDGSIVARTIEVGRVGIRDPLITKEVVEADVTRLRAVSNSLVEEALEDYSDDRPVQNAIVALLDSLMADCDGDSDNEDKDEPVVLVARVTEPAMMIIS